MDACVKQGYKVNNSLDFFGLEILWWYFLLAERGRECLVRTLICLG